MNPKIDAYLNESPDWRAELERLREIALDTPLSEELKWKQPCYTYEGANVVILARLKDCCTFGFFKGALLKDSERVLEKPGENSQSARVVRFTGMQAIDDLATVLKAYIAEAIENEKQGLKVEFKEASDFDLPEELQAEFEGDPAFKQAWEALTPGRRRGYILHFSSAKQSATCVSRIEKCMPRIMAGKGIHDCICGHSRKMPRCDGSHQFY